MPTEKEKERGGSGEEVGKRAERERKIILIENTKMYIIVVKITFPFL